MASHVVCITKRNVFFFFIFSSLIAGHFGTSPTDFIEVEVTGMFGPFLC